jgi:cathepsin L
MARVVLLVLALAAVALAWQPHLFSSMTRSRALFDSFTLRYNKTYTTDAERQKRFAIFVSNVAYINSFNAAGNATYSLGINQFADLTNAEFRAMMNGYRANPNAIRNEIKAQDIPRREVTCPSNGAMYTCDWRQAGVVTPIKNQGQCGSCWAFSAVASSEGAHALNTGKLVSLSEQNLVDCSKAEGNQGCNGGLMDQAFQYIIKNDGIDTEASYPYKGVDGACKYKAADSGATLTSFKNLPRGNEATLAQACESVGPISVAIDASHNSFQFYTSGVYYEPGCSTTQLDHGVTVVGYGVDQGKDFWLVKNSWGTSWGMQGYILMSRNRDNNCGIATQPSYPIA